MRRSSSGRLKTSSWWLLKEVAKIGSIATSSDTTAPRLFSQTDLLETKAQAPQAWPSIPSTTCIKKQAYNYISNKQCSTETGTYMQRHQASARSFFPLSCRCCCLLPSNIWRLSNAKSRIRNYLSHLISHLIEKELCKSDHTKELHKK